MPRSRESNRRESRRQRSKAEEDYDESDNGQENYDRDYNPHEGPPSNSKHEYSQDFQQSYSQTGLFNENINHIQKIVEVEGNLSSPIDINLSYTTRIILPPLIWHHHELAPKKMKMTNSGHTVIISAKWHEERPYLSGGPFIGNYVFSQMHFHWGLNNMEGSEHTVDGCRLPMEMHVVLFRTCYLTQEAALRKKDGISVLVYFFKLQGFPNPNMQVLIDHLESTRKPHTSVKLLPPLPLDFLYKPFENDYFLYWGSVKTTACTHSVLWLLSREVIGISMYQMQQFRTLLDINEEPLLRNFRSISFTNGPTTNHVYHISPSKSRYSTLLHFSHEVQLEKSPFKSEHSYRCSIIEASPFRSNRNRSHKKASKVLESVENNSDKEGIDDLRGEEDMGATEDLEEALFLKVKKPTCCKSKCFECASNDSI